MNIESWQFIKAGAPLRRGTQAVNTLNGDQVLVKVAGCGVCHTDLGFVYDGVRTRHPLPLTLGHEIAGHVVATGPESALKAGDPVVVPAVIPCGECPACQAGRGAICPNQFFPGNDDHGGFASHVVVPGRGLCAINPMALKASGIELAAISVVADAVTTPYQAILNANLKPGDLAIFVGVGGVGGFGVQIAAAVGATVVAIDVDPTKLASASAASLHLQSTPDLRGIKTAIRSFASEQGCPSTGWKIFETSGHPAGQELAFSLLGYDAHLAVVGYTRAKISVRLSNLMAFDATLRGTWGCLPEHYPAVVDLVLSGKVDISSFVEAHPMSQINEVFEALHRHELKRRPVLIPDFS